jgi:hypothetical protein
MSGVMVFEQLTGPRRRIELRGRSMPYRPLLLSGTQEITTTWMPANPKAIQQVIGPRFEPTTVNGVWKDKYLAGADSSVTLKNFPRLSAAASGLAGASSSTFVGPNAFPGEQRARLARVVGVAFELLRREGQDIRWQWDQYVRFGKVKRFEQKIGDTSGLINDIGWTLEMAWSGDIAAPPIIVKTTVNLLATAQGLAKLVQDLNAALDKIEILQQPNAFVNAIATPVGNIVAAVSALIAALRKIVSVTSLPSDLAKTVGAQLQTLKLLAANLRSEIDAIMPASGEAAKVGNADAVQIALLVQQSIRKRLVELASFAAEQLRLLQLFDGDEVLATIFADSVSSLRDVATRFYGSPEEWLRISNFNAFYSSTVPAGTLIRIPRIS